MKAIIAGGGIGGLTAALCLVHFGWDVEVLEQSPELGDVGAGIQLSPNAMKVYAALGLVAALERAAFRPEAISLRMGESGMRLLSSALGKKAEVRWGAPYLHCHRADLINVLQEALAETGAASVSLGQSVQAYRQDGDDVSVQLASGEVRQASVLIGADGIHSVIRAQMLGSDSPVFTGNVAWRAVVPVARLGQHAPDPAATAWMGRGKHAVTYLLRGGQLANLVAVVERDDWTMEGWREPGDKAAALADFDGWHPIVTRLLEETDTLYRWALFDRPPLAQWTDGYVALLGDAAHPMLPFMAQGAAMAIEDAWALAAHLSRNENKTDALVAYQAVRHKRASTVQAASRANAKTFHQCTLAGQLKTYGPMWLAGHIWPAIGRMRQDWVYGYDIVSALASD